MNFKRIYKQLMLLIVAAILLSFPCFGEASHHETRVLVIETTDIHGNLFDASSGDPNTFQYRMAYLAHLFTEARDSGTYDDVLLLDGGDLYQGTPVSNITHGAAIRAAMDRMHYDAIVLGNHDFDWDVRKYAADSDATIAPYTLGDYSGDSDTPVLAADLYDAQSNERVSFTKDYSIIEKAGKRIAVIGYIPDYSASIMPDQIAPYRIDGDLEKLDALVHHVKKAEQSDAIMILAHTPPESVAEAMDPKLVSLVAGGHDHKAATGTSESGISYMQGGCCAQGYASAVLVFCPDGIVRVEDMQYHDITAERELLFDTEENAAHLDPGIMEISHAAWKDIQDEMSEVLGYIDKPVVSSWDIGASSGGNWYTELMLKAAKPYGAVAAFYNTGGIRTNFEIPDGEKTRAVTVYDVYNIAPFGNKLLMYEISSAELKQQLINGLSTPRYGDQMSGLTFTYIATGDDSMKREDREYTILSITLSDGTEIDMEDTQTLYRVCIGDFNAKSPGSVFEGKDPLIPEAEAPTDNETLIRLLREEGAENNGYLTVDGSPRGMEIRIEQSVPLAA